jgi:hypothetical protein
MSYYWTILATEYRLRGVGGRDLAQKVILSPAKAWKLELRRLPDQLNSLVEK